jgi:hypothetical protein
MTRFALPLVGFGFANPWMLWYLVAAAAPLLLHLWHRRRQRETPWAAIELLLSAVRSQARRIRIQQWLLLAVRTLLIMLLVVATAEPYITRLGLPPAAGQRTHKVLVIDGSYSMAYGGPDDNRFVRAKQLAAQIVDESRQGDGLTLVLMAATARPLVATPVFDPKSFTQQIDDLSLPHAGGDLIAALGAVEQILLRAQREHPELERSEVYFITDLGRTSWQPGGDGQSGQARREVAYRSAVTRLADMATLVVLDVGPAGSENLAVTGLTTTAAFVHLAEEVPFEVVVRNFGREAVTNRQIELRVDGALAGQAPVDLPPGAATTIQWNHRFLRSGSHVVEARCVGDRLDIDNHRWLSVPARPFLKVLCVAGKRAATDYLALALDPDQSPTAAIRIETISDSELLETDLTPYDAIFLANVGQFTTGEARLLDDYAHQGGSMVFFLGDQVDAERYNRVLAGPSQRDRRLLPARIGDVVTQPQYGFDPLGYRHPIVEAFRGRQRSGLLTVPVYHYFRLTVPESWRQSRVVATFRNGDPAIVEGPVGRGRVVLVATAGSLSSVDAARRTPWTALPVWPSFLPLVREMLAYSMLARQAHDNVLVGQPFGAPHSPVSSPTFVRIDTPRGRQVQRRIERQGNEMVWAFAATDQSGVYTVHIPPPQAGTRHFAVNVDTAESDLRRVAADQLPEELLVRTDWQADSTTPRPGLATHRGAQRWPLYAAFGLLLSELGLAWWLGREVAE